MSNVADLHLGSRSRDTLRVRVVKIGGSLMKSSSTMLRAVEWVERPTVDDVTIIVVGGGEHAEAVRSLDRRFHLEPRSADRMARRAMSVLSWTLAHVSGWRYEADWMATKRWTAEQGGRIRSVRIGPPMSTNESDVSNRCILDLGRCFADVEQVSDEPPLPTTWAVTSDSMSARLARAIASPVVRDPQAKCPNVRLVLLKSCLPFCEPSLATERAGLPTFDAQEASRIGYVDECFPSIVKRSPKLDVMCAELYESKKKNAPGDVDSMCRLI